MLGAAAVGCDKKDDELPAPAAGRAGGADDASPKAIDAPRAGGSDDSGVLVHPATRCGDCHNKMLSEWSGSAHARASSSKVFRAALAKAAGDATCLGCHRPLARHVDPREPAVNEGVTCDVCHNIREVKVGKRSSSFNLEVDDNVKYGPRCDAEGHYFHEMGCSPLHTSAELCAACHNWYRPLPDGRTLPVYTTYRDWKDGPFGGKTPCQDCHMPGAEAPVAIAEGEKPRADVPHHGQLGTGGELRKRAARLSATFDLAGERIRVTTSVENKGAGHMIPTGLPARRLLVRVTLEQDGAEPVVEEQAYGRVLVDARGNATPFFAAVGVGSDTRIAPDSERRHDFHLHAPAAGRLRIELLWQSMAPAIAAAIGTDPREETLAAIEAPVLAPSTRSRRGLPKTVKAP